MLYSAIMNEPERRTCKTYDLPGGLTFDPASGEIRKGLQTLTGLTPLEGKALEILVSHPDEVVDTKNLVKQLYPGERGYEEDFGNLNRHQSVIKRLRTALRGISPDLAKQLETFASRGYRWTVDIIPPND